MLKLARFAIPAAIAATATSYGVRADADVEDTFRTQFQAAESATDKPGPARRFAVELNPLSVAIGRLSGTFEWAARTHDVFLVSPFAMDLTGTIDSGATRTHIRTSGGGAELGYRYYTGTRGMNGLFLGPSLIWGVYDTSLPLQHHTFSNAGVALDAGFQLMFFDAMTVGAGIGAQYTFATHTENGMPLAMAANAAGGLRPRLLASIGYTF
jgi:hypothetical protein